MANLSEDIATKVQESLKDGPYACSSLEKLSGGTSNFVFRGYLRLPLEDGTATVVVKHTEPYVALNPAFKLASARCVRNPPLYISIYTVKIVAL